MRSLPAVLVLLAALAGTCQVSGPPAASFQARYLYDEDNSSLSFIDLQFASGAHGMAIGIYAERGRTRARGLLTRDGGGTWELVEIPKESRSLFFLDDKQAWIAGGDGIYHSRDGGREWSRVSRINKALRVHFLDARRGFAVGFEKKMWQTANGGKDWKELPVVDEIKADARRSVFTWIDFVSPDVGFVLGHHEPLSRGFQTQFPEWMDPESYRRRRQLPSLSLMLQTADGGLTWKADTASIMGRITRHRAIAGGRRLSLVEYEQGFDWPSEVYRTFNHGKDTASTFREKDRAITDIALLPNGVGYLAGFAPSGALSRLPIPGRVHIYRSVDLVRWEALEVDYRAIARRVHLARVPNGGIWAATDTGMLLQLVVR